MRTRANVALSLALVVGVAGLAFAACVDPPPKIAAIPPNGISLRVFVFGASAQEGRQAFESAKQTNQKLRIVHEGGDGEVLVGLENDSPKCVPPTALCSYKIALRVRDNQGKVVHTAATTASVTAEHCSDLCTKALNEMVVKAIEAAAASLKVGGAEGDASSPEPAVAEAAEAGAASSAVASASAASSARPPVKKAAGKPASSAASKAEPGGKGEPMICAVAHGPHLPADEAEKRAAQVETLKRLDVLEQDEYDCLRKAYLDRL